MHTHIPNTNLIHAYFFFFFFFFSKFDWSCRHPKLFFFIIFFYFFQILIEVADIQNPFFLFFYSFFIISNHDFFFSLHYFFRCTWHHYPLYSFFFFFFLYIWCSARLDSWVKTQVESDEDEGGGAACAAEVAGVDRLVVWQRSLSTATEHNHGAQPLSLDIEHNRCTACRRGSKDL